MKALKLNLLIILLGLSFVSVALPPDIQADRYLVQVEKALKDEDYDKAVKAMDKIMALKDQHNLELPIEFYFKYAKVSLKSRTKTDKALAAINHYLTTTGKSSANYFEALDLYNQAELQIEQLILFVTIPAGSFRMGDIQGGGLGYEKPVHNVTIPEPFYMGKTEVTQAQWQGVMGNNPSHGRVQGDHPVEGVSWDDIQAFIAKLNQQTGKHHRLPSEAEWKYAARAGNTTKYGWGNDISHDNANYGTNECCGGLASGKDRWETTSPVASFAPNAWGLYDMAGNVWEWTQDCWHGDYDNAPTNGSAWENEDGGDCAVRVLRGGSWINDPDRLRSAGRVVSTASDHDDSSGFRLVQDL